MRTLAARLIRIKAGARARADKDGLRGPGRTRRTEPKMPASSIPGVALVIGMFAVFMIMLGGTQLRLFLADRREARQTRA